LTAVTPRGVQRGTEAVLTLGGNNLSDTQDVFFHTPGVTTKKLEVVNNTQVKLTVNVPPDCRLGEHSLRVRTASGVTGLMTFWVGPYPAVEEKEPNNDFTAPQPIPLNVTVNGTLPNEDVDYYAVECKKGQRLSVEIEGLRLGGPFFDPYIAILDSKRFELATCDDTPLLRQDACASVVIPADGTYVIQVRESAYRGGGASYRLHVGTFPRPLAIVPAGGKCGEEVEVRFIGDPKGEFRQKVKLPATPDRSFALFPQDADGVCPSGFPFRLSEHGNTVESGSNNTPQTATAGPVPGAFNGVISKPGEVDYYRFTAKKGQTFDIHCRARRIGSPLDSVMVVSMVGGGDLIGNDDTNGPDSYVRFTAPDDKDYLIRVTDHLGKGGPTYFYRIEVTPIEPRIVTTIPQFVQYSQDRQWIVVPRGNRSATLIRATRVNVGGPLDIGVAGLPAGVKLDCEPMDPGRDMIPVVFEAPADVKLAGSLASLTATPPDPNLKVPCRTHLSAELVYSSPGQSLYWQHEIDRVPVAVTEAVPFTIKVVEPKVPLVQNGSMNLKVVAERRDGFKAPITVVALWNPPGVNSASAVTIPEGQTETVMPVNAAGNASARKWKMAVLATAPVGNGPVWVSSQLFTLEVAPPFVSFAIERTMVEQGKDATMFCKVRQNTPFDGPATVKLLGLPNKVTASDLTFTKDVKELSFPLKVDKTSPAGQHRNIFCQVVVTQNGEPIVHHVGSAELRIDAPLPPKPDAPAKVAAAPPPPKPAAQPPAAAPPKRLTRLEQLRLEQEEREIAMKNGSPPPK
jgi:hypothetical protein